MAQAKRKKKKPPGGASGAPPRSEPRVQIFTKFAGCNFQLAARNFDDLFGEDQDAQTDLMPMLMAIQNNAKIAPFGGIETRQNLVELFDAPAGKHLTGVATLIGNELYAACDDMTIHYGNLPTSGVGTLTDSVNIDDHNDSYNEAVKHTVSGNVGYGSEAIAVSHTTASSKVSTSYASYLLGQSFPITAGHLHTGVTLKVHNPHPHDVYLNVDLHPMGASWPPTEGYPVAFGIVQVPSDHDGEIRCTWTNNPFAVSATADYAVVITSADSGVDVELYYDSNAGYTSGKAMVMPVSEPLTWADGVPGDATADFYFKSWEASPGFTSEHTVTETGMLMKVRYQATYDIPSGPPLPVTANVKVYHGTVNDELIYSGEVVNDTDIPILHNVTVGDHVTMVVEATGEYALTGTWGTDFYEAVEDNTWTFLGYADDQLVGMTANQQIWNGDLGDHLVANALTIVDPDVLLFTDLAVIGGAGITIHDTYEVANPHRITLRYTVLNRFGPTLPSNPLTFYASKPSTEWTSLNFVQINGHAANEVGVIAVELYYTEGEYQEPAFLGRVNLPDIAHDAHEGNVKPWSFNWTGYQTDTSMWTIANLTPPVENYSEGAPASKMAVLDGQLYFWGNTTYPYRIWIGGQPGNRFSVSPGTGGGFVDVEPGVGTEVKKVMKFKTQQGAAIVTALCDNPNSQREARFNLVESTIAISDEQSVKGWMAEKIAGAVGCKSSNGAVAAGDGLYAVSRYGLAITTLTMEYNSQLQVMYVSDPIAPVFLKQLGHQLDLAVLFEVNGVLYMTFSSEDGTLDNVLFCYDIALKAWWTYTLDTDTPILNMIAIDFDGTREGIGIITEDHIYLLPTTVDEGFDVLPTHEILIESGELTTMQPLQSMHHLTQLEFRFDYFIGDMDLAVTMIDQFGRLITTTRHIHHDTLQHQLSEYMRIDAVVESYKVVMSGHAKMRLTHFLAKLYPKSNRIGMSWGFDSQQGHNTHLMRRTFTSYNDLRDAIIP